MLIPYVMKGVVTMKDKARLWKIAILSVILLSFAGLVTYKVIAGTLGASSPCPSSPTCPSTINCPPQGEVDKTCPMKGAAEKEACKLRSGDESKKTCPQKGQCDKKPDCDQTAKQCGL